MAASDLARSWADAHAQASAAESRLCGAIVHHVRGDGERPGAILKERALSLRRRANQLRDALQAAGSPS